MIYIIQYLSDFFASYSYVVARKTYKNIFYSTTEAFAYCNIYILFTILILHPFLKKKYNFNLLNIKNYFHNKKIIIATLLSVSASYFKTILLSNICNISQSTLRSYSILSPFITLILCHFFLKDQKINKNIIFCFIICFIGFLIFNISINSLINISYIIILYIFLNGYSDYKLKQVSKSRGVEMMFFDNIMFLFISLIVFIIAEFNVDFTKTAFGINKFNIYKVANTSSILPLIFIAFLSFMAHNLKMISYKAKYIAGIMIAGAFFKSFNSILMTYMQDNVLPNYKQIIGMLFMSIGLSLFFKSYAKK